MADTIPADWIKYLKEKGLRITGSREAIISAMSRSREHLSAEELYLQIHRKHPNIGLTTVYRTLSLLSRAGLIFKFDFGDGRARFELLGKAKGPVHHHHLICTCCQKVYDYTDFVEEEMELVKKTERALSHRYNFEINDHVIQFYGICNRCRTKRGI